MTKLTRRLSSGEATLELWLDSDARAKRRQICEVDGRELRIELERLDTPLADGDRLAGNDLIVRVRARSERLIEARGATGALMRGAFHLGNRHAKVMIGDGFLRTADDPVMLAMLAQLGLTVTTVEAPFTPEIGAYHHHGPGHGHDEAHCHGHGQARIHRIDRASVK